MPGPPPQLTRLWRVIPAPDRHSGSYTRWLRDGRWLMDELWRRLLRVSVDRLAPGEVLTLPVDDTLAIATSGSDERCAGRRGNLGRVRYREFQPAPPLKSLVSCYWTLDREYSGGAAQKETVWPDGRPELLFHYGCRYRRDGEPLDHGILLGPLTRRLLLVSEGRIRLVAVRLHPWGLAGLLGVGVDELTDAVLPIETLWGARGRRLVERLGEAGENEAVRVLDAFLRREARMVPADLRPIAMLAGTILDRPRAARGAAFEGRSRRQFERRFKQVVGLSPTRFAVVARFDSARRHLIADPGADLSDVACRFGYCDYAHMSRDFSRFLGITPGALRAEVAAPPPGEVRDVAFIHDAEPGASPAWRP